MSAILDQGAIACDQERHRAGQLRQITLVPAPTVSRDQVLRHIYAFDSKRMVATRMGIFLRVLPGYA